MRFEKLKIGDKFIFDFDIENDVDDERPRGRIQFMKTAVVKDNYYTYNAVALTNENKGRFLEVGKYKRIIPIE